MIIFEDDRDRHKFLDSVRETVVDNGVAVLAWCIMPNHVHLLLHDRVSRLSEAMHALQTVYALYFNRVHDRVGPVFQGRFKSVPVENEAYLLTVVRYIHENPLRAGLSRSVDHPWTSYSEYNGARTGFTDVRLVLELYGGVEAFVRESQVSLAGVNVGRVMKACGDEDDLTIVHAVLGDVSLGEIKALPVAQRDSLLCCLGQAGFNARAISRLTGIGRSIVYRVLGDHGLPHRTLGTGHDK